MKKEDFCEVLGDIRDDYVKGARENRKGNHTRKWVAWGAAACACLILGGALLLHPPRGDAPNPDRVQIASPILEVESVEEMERTLDFSVPMLDKAVDAYIVLVIDGYPESARIQYADQTTFSMKYGSGDISGIYGGTLEKEEEIGGVTVSFCRYREIRYATWEKDGFTYSLSGGEGLEEDVASLIP